MSGDELPGTSSAVPPDGEFEPEHVYLSTGCLHGQHLYCQSRTIGFPVPGGLEHHAKVPATCKFCSAPCICSCHREKSA